MASDNRHKEFAEKETRYYRQIESISRLLLEFASGNFKTRLTTAEGMNELDEIITGINMLGEELEHTTISRNYLNTLFEGITDMLFVLQSNFTIQKINSAVSMKLGYSEQELMNKSFLLLFCERKPDLPETVKNKINKKRNCYSFESVVKSKYDSQIPVCFSFSRLPAFIGPDRQILCLGKDISEYKIQESQLKNKNQNFLSCIGHIGHDLRNILAPLMEFLELAKFEIHPADPARHYLEMIEKSTTQIHYLLMDLLRFVRITSVSFSRGKIYFNHFIQGVLSGLKNIPEFRDVSFSVRVSQKNPFRADPELLGVAIRILIEHAVIFRRNYHNTVISIQIRQNTRGIQIKIHDNGTPLPGSMLTNERVEPNKGNHGQQVPGLSIFLMKSTVDKLGGNVRIESSTKNGTSFNIFLPENHRSSR